MTALLLAKYLPLVEVAYKSSFHRSWKMSPLRAPIGAGLSYKFANPNLPIPTTKNTLDKMDRKMQVIRQSFKRTSDQPKSYVDLHRFSRIFLTRDKVFLREFLFDLDLLRWESIGNYLSDTVDSLKS